MAWVPVELTDTRVVVTLVRSRTKMSESALLSPVIRLVAKESNATNWPSPEMAGKVLLPLD